jgi:hypothetical protein
MEEEYVVLQTQKSFRQLYYLNYFLELIKECIKNFLKSRCRLYLLPSCTDSDVDCRVGFVILFAAATFPLGFGAVLLLVCIFSPSSLERSSESSSSSFDFHTGPFLLVPLDVSGGGGAAFFLGRPIID